MLQFTSHKFKLKFGIKPHRIYDMKPHIDQALRDELVNTPLNLDVALFGFMSGDMPHYYMLNTLWSLSDQGEPKGLIECVTLFDSKEEMEIFRTRLQRISDLMVLQNKKHL